MRKKPIVGLDVGDVRIGVALSDELQMLAHPSTIIERADGDPAQAVVDLAHKSQAQEIVVGLPKNMDGSLGPQARKVQAFAKRLSQLAPELRIRFWDERLSTQEARANLLRSGARKKVRSKPVDALSASIILQAYLEFLRHASQPNE